MKLVSRALLSAVALTALLGFCASADAAVTTLGPNLSSAIFTEESCEEACTLVDTAVTQPGARVLAPSNGVILRWHVIEGTTPGEYHLRIASPLGSGVFQFASIAGVASAATPGLQTFTPSTPIPIKAGQTVGLEMSKTASVGVTEGIGSFAEWLPTIADGTAKKPTFGGPATAGFNAEMQPAPTVASLGTTSGVTTGGTPVTITGTDFEGTSAVTFGTTPATSFVVNSETQITAVAPASAAAAAVPVTVTTVAGAATAPQTYTYVKPVYCVVPNLKGRTLTAAKTALTKAKCTLGTVKKLAGASFKTGKVTKQGSKVGTQLPVGSKIAVTLKSPKPAGKKHGKK